MADTLFVDQETVVPTAWLQAVNDASYKGRNPNFVTSTGAADAQVVTLPAGSLYDTPENGDSFVFKAGFTNSGPATLQLVGAASTGVLPLEYKGAALIGGEVLVDQLCQVVYLNGTWQLLSNYAGTSAAGISFSPYGWLGSNNVQDALEEVVDDLGATTGATLIGFKSSASAAIATTLSARANAYIDAAADYGVTADGVTDDTAALQAAVDGAVAAGKRLELPKGTIRITAPILVNNALGLFIRGQGRQNTFIKAEFAGSAALYFNSTGAAPSAQTMIAHLGIETTGYNTPAVLINYHANQARNMFYDCQFFSDMNGNAASVFKSSASGLLNLLNCELYATHANAWALELADYNQNTQLTDCEITNVGNGMRITHGAGGRVEGTRLTSCLFLVTGDVALQVNNSLLTILNNCTIDQFNNIGIEIEASADSVQMNGGWIGIKTAPTGAQKSCVYIHEDSGSGHVFNEVEIAFSNYGIEFKAAGALHVCPMIIAGNIFQGNIGTAAKAALRFDSVSRVVVTGNVDKTDESGTATNYNGTYELNTTVAGNSIQFTGNRVRPKGAGGTYTVGGTASSYQAINEGGSGSLLVAQGSANPGGAASGTIAHGLMTTPARADLTFARTAGTATGIWVTSLDATNISWAATAALTGSIYWRAQASAT